ncbi:MAG: DUF4185 domain-containing protein [Candidatus Saccharimonadales bacterium]
MASPRLLQRITGADTPPCYRWFVCGTDLGIPYLLPNGIVGYIFGDTFDTAMPGRAIQTGGWRSPVILRSASNPAYGRISFDTAAGAVDSNMAPEVMYNGHFRQGEVSAIPNDAVSLPDGRHIMSIMSVAQWLAGTWRTNYTQLAVSTDGGNSFQRTDTRWDNPYGTDTQMISMQLDGEYIYLIGVRAGRVMGPMHLMRVPWRNVLDSTAYRCWTGTLWTHECTGVYYGQFGEPSLRKLRDGTWAMAYLNIAKRAIVTRWAINPTGPWSDEKVQITDQELPSLYGGFIHPYSGRNSLTLMISTWQAARYDVSQLTGLTLPLDSS